MKRKHGCAKLTEREMKKVFHARGTKSDGYEDDDDEDEDEGGDEDEDEGGDEDADEEEGGDDDDSFDSYHQYPRRIKT